MEHKACAMLLDVSVTCRIKSDSEQYNRVTCCTSMVDAQVQCLHTCMRTYVDVRSVDVQTSCLMEVSVCELTAAASKRSFQTAHLPCHIIATASKPLTA